MSALSGLRPLWARRHWYLKRWRNPGPPWFINIEPTNLCNLRCTVCSHDGSRPAGFMPLSLCRRLVEQAVCLGVSEARFFLAGEPLLHPRLPEFIGAAKEAGLDTCVHTNATRLDDGLSLSLIARGLDLLSISFDGEDRETYETVQVRASFDDTVARIRRFLELRDRYGARPRTMIQVLKPYQHGKPLGVSRELRLLFSSHPPDRYVALHPHTWAGEMTELPTPPRPGTYHPCLPLWEGISVYWDGRVPLCCGDLNGRTVVGDATTQDLGQIWYGETLREARRLLAQGKRRAGRMCPECDALWHRTHPMLRDAVCSIVRRALA